HGPGSGDVVPRQAEHVVADPMTVAVPEGDVVPVMLDRATPAAGLLERVDHRHPVALVGEQCGRRETPERRADDDGVELLLHETRAWPGRSFGGTSTQWVPL